MGYEAINFDKKFSLFDEQWQPKVIAEMNNYQFKVVKLEGDFIWHDHKDFHCRGGGSENRFSRWCRSCVGGRDVRRPEGR
jgi:hypothetical protein